jgi:hypothetical protein
VEVGVEEVEEGEEEREEEGDIVFELTEKGAMQPTWWLCQLPIHPATDFSAEWPVKRFIV